MNTLKTTACAAAALFAATLGANAQEPTRACIITKTDINPFFVKMKEGAEEKGRELGVEIMAYAGKIDGDHETQQQAMESCIAAGVKGILLVASDPKAIVAQVEQVDPAAGGEQAPGDPRADEPVPAGDEEAHGVTWVVKVTADRSPVRAA